MLYKRIWKESRQIPDSTQHTEWIMEGWYLFGFIPLYVRDTNSRGTYGYVPDQPTV